MTYRIPEVGDANRVRMGSAIFYELLEQMADTHDKKSHDYASNGNPFANYHFAGTVAHLFAHSPKDMGFVGRIAEKIYRLADMGFVGRIAEKIYRLANLESSGKSPRNESVDDTEIDICVITILWMASRRNERRSPADTGPADTREPMVKVLEAAHHLGTHDVEQLQSYLSRYLSDLKSGVPRGNTPRE